MAAVLTRTICMPPFEAENPDFAAMVAASFAKQGLMQALGIELLEVTPGGCVLAVAADPRLTQQNGLFHGALIGAMLDSAGGYAGYSLMPAGSEVLTIEYKVNFIAGAAGERLIARGRVIRPGRTITVTMAEAFCVQDNIETACAVMLQSLIRVTASR
jgi:uncharacterized protein (TIGR00369 family)